MLVNKYILLSFLCPDLQNGDGFISAKELGVLMRAMGRNPTEDEIMQIMNEIDIDHNGNLRYILSIPIYITNLQYIMGIEIEKY